MDGKLTLQPFDLFDFFPNRGGRGTTAKPDNPVFQPQGFKFSLHFMQLSSSVNRSALTGRNNGISRLPSEQSGFVDPIFTANRARRMRICEFIQNHLPLILGKIFANPDPCDLFLGGIRQPGFDGGHGYPGSRRNLTKRLSLTPCLKHTLSHRVIKFLFHIYSIGADFKLMYIKYTLSNRSWIPQRPMRFSVESSLIPCYQTHAHVPYRLISISCRSFSSCFTLHTRQSEKKNRESMKNWRGTCREVYHLAKTILPKKIVGFLKLFLPVAV